MGPKRTSRADCPEHRELRGGNGRSQAIRAVRGPRLCRTNQNRAHGTRHQCPDQPLRQASIRDCRIG
jgi:hypothetical protein